MAQAAQVSIRHSKGVSRLPVISLESKVGISTLQSPHRTLLVLALDCFCFFVFIPETAMLNS